MTFTPRTRTFIVTIDRPTMQAMKTDAELAAAVMARLVFYNKTHEVPNAQGLVYRRVFTY